MFKPALARGEIQCIGATTLDEYRQYIEKDGALERRFQKVMVDPTSPEETIEILDNIKEKYENHHLVQYTPEAITACVTLTLRYITDRYLPDKAIDALDEAGARVHMKNIKVPAEIVTIENSIEDIRLRKTAAINSQKFEEAANYRDTERKLSLELEKAKKRWEDDSRIHREQVTEENVSEVVAMMTGIPIQRVAQNEGERLVAYGRRTCGSVIGQEMPSAKWPRPYGATGRTERPQQAHRQLHFPWPHRRRQNPYGQSAGQVSLRLGRRAHPHRHERIHGKIRRIATGWRAPGLCGI